MLNTTNLSRSLKLQLMATVAVSAAGAVPAVAADAPAANVEKVTVTGTRLKKRDYTTTSPVTTVGSQTLELTQTTSTEALLNELPQLVPGNTFTSNNSGGEDFSTLDLRGLGPNRTLILLNGNRLPASSTTGTVDISTVPVGLIDRIEVVTGGASAVYGSDAISGVVNFILKRDYEGMQVSASVGQAEGGLAETRYLQAMVGGNFAGGNGNITAFADYTSREGVYQSEFEFSRISGSYCYSYATGTYSVIDTVAEARACRNQAGGGFVGAGGSGTPPWGWITNNAANAFSAATLTTNAATAARFTAQDLDCNPSTAATNYTGGNLSFNDAGQLTPRFTSGACGVPDRSGGSSRYSFAPDNYIVLPAERYNVSMFGHYDIEKDLTLNFGVLYSDTYQQVSLAPTPATGLTVTLTDNMRNLIQANAPDLWVALQSRPNAYRTFTMDRRTNEVGRRVGHNENSSLAVFTSLEGQINDAWSYEIAASFADIDFVTRAENSVNKTALLQGLAGCQASTNGLDGIAGTLDDVSVNLGAAALPGCVALDIFGPGTLTQSMVNFLKVTTWSRTQSEESTMSGFLSGELWDLFGAGPLGVVAGGEYRYSKASFEVDDQQRTGNIFGFNATQDQNGSIDVYEGYTEVSLPIVKDQPFIHYLGAEAGYRISDYSSVGIVHTYKYGGEYSPFEWLKFRGVYNKATRAPSVFELFQNGDQGFPSFTEPCRDTNGDGIPNQNQDTSTINDVDLALCQALATYNDVGPFVANNSQVQAFAFGNSNLSPETAETTTYGVVLQTGNDWFGLGNLRGSVDWYEIEIDDVVATFGAQYFLNDCYASPASATRATSCARVSRNPVTGQVDFVNTTRANEGNFATNGIDIQVDYRLDLEDIGLDGILSINELYSIIDSYQFNGNESVGTTDAGIGGATFDWKSVLDVTYRLDDWTVNTRWSYVPELTDSLVGQLVPAASYVDMAVRYTPTEWMAITLSVSNVADEAPAQTIGGLFSQANTDPQVYDVLGRSWALEIRTKM